MFAFSGQTRSMGEDSNTKILKIIQLEDGINITKIPEDKILLEYSAPRGDMEIYKSATSTGVDFNLGIGFKTTTV